MEIFKFVGSINIIKMVYIEKRKRGKHTYLYLCKKERIHGKIKRTLNIYLGKEENLNHRLKDRLAHEKELKNLETYSFGYIAALWKMAELLNLSAIINKNSNKRKQGLSLGEYITLAVINRIDEPCSKNSISKWLNKTWFAIKRKYDPKTLSGQAYWNHLGYLDENTIEKIELNLNKRVLKIFNIDLDCLLFDPTNFHTFIKTPKAGDLPRRGKAKSGRNDLKIVALSLLVTRKMGLPLMHKVYAGNTHDSKHFKSVIPEFIKRFKALNQDVKKITVIFDKGNNSPDNIDKLRDKKINFIATLRPSSFKHLLTHPESEFIEVKIANGKTLLACEVKEEVYGLPNQRVIITKDKKSEKRSVLELLDRLDYIAKELTELREKLNWKVWKHKDRVQNKVEIILSRKAGKCFIVQVDGQDGNLSMTIELTGDEFKNMKESYGRSFLTTNRADLSMAEVISDYHEQYIVEDDFKKMKCAESIRANPIYHWTDQKISAHLFICVIALLMKNILREYIARQGLKLSHKEIKQYLERIHYVQYELPNGKMGFQLSSMSGITKKLAELLALPPLIKI